jgi:(E)-4-hydroxy-3-methylbut-2-enyl-diphosphate synthase
MSHNPIRPWRNIDRRKTRQIHVGPVAVGGDAPITVQTMTNTLTTDVKATVRAGAGLRRGGRRHRAHLGARRGIFEGPEGDRAAKAPCPSWPTSISTTNAGSRRRRPARPACRINPGNIGDEKRVKEVIKAARDHDCAIRIGVNAGSLEKHLLDKYGEPCPDAMVESGLDHIRILEDNDFLNFKISMKASDVFMTVAAYQMLAEQTEAPFHLGITEAGGFVGGTVKSAIGLGSLLWAGLGDTLRVSLSADPVEEVKIGFEILKSLGLRHRGVNIISCPSCARQGFDVIKTVETLEKRLEHIKTPMSLSIIGCVVNGPGEALMTDVGFTGGGAGSGMVYLAGKQSHKMSNDQMVDHIVEQVEKKAEELEAARAAEAQAAE